MVGENVVALFADHKALLMLKLSRATLLTNVTRTELRIKILVQGLLVVSIIVKKGCFHLRHGGC